MILFVPPTPLCFPAVLFFTDLSNHFQITNKYYTHRRTVQKFLRIVGDQNVDKLFSLARNSLPTLVECFCCEFISAVDSIPGGLRDVFWLPGID